jgi:hypothetical protein
MQGTLCSTRRLVSCRYTDPTIGPERLRRGHRKGQVLPLGLTVRSPLMENDRHGRELSLIPAGVGPRRSVSVIGRQIVGAVCTYISHVNDAFREARHLTCLPLGIERLQPDRRHQMSPKISSDTPFEPRSPLWNCVHLIGRTTHPPFPVPRGRKEAVPHFIVLFIPDTNLHLMSEGRGAWMKGMSCLISWALVFYSVLDYGISTLAEYRSPPVPTLGPALWSCCHSFHLGMYTRPLASDMVYTLHYSLHHGWLCSWKYPR